MCGRYLSTDTVAVLSSSINEDYRQLSTRSLIYGENKVYRKQLFVKRMCGSLVHWPSPNYITVSDVIDDIDLMSSLRMMHDCVFRHYTGFAFRKHSPYTQLFDWHIRR